MLDEHDRGRFTRSALLADLLRRDADVFGALQQRLLTMGAHPVCVDPRTTAPRRRPRPTARRRVAADLPAAPPSTCGPTRPCWASRGRRCSGSARPRRTLTQRLEPVHAAAVEYDRSAGRWYVSTVDAGRVEMTPATASGCSSRTAPSARRGSGARSDRALSGTCPTPTSRATRGAAAKPPGRGSEGVPPAGAREAIDGKKYLAALRNIGRAAVIPVPRGQTPETSYDLELVEAKADAYKIFEWLKRAGGGAIRPRAAGPGPHEPEQHRRHQRLVGDRRRRARAIVEASARGWSEAVTARRRRARARYLGRPPAHSRRRGSPRPT